MAKLVKHGFMVVIVIVAAVGIVALMFPNCLQSLQPKPLKGSNAFKTAEVTSEAEAEMQQLPLICVVTPWYTALMARPSSTRL